MGTIENDHKHDPEHWPVNVRELKRQNRSKSPIDQLRKQQLVLGQTIFRGVDPAVGSLMRKEKLSYEFRPNFYLKTVYTKSPL